MSVGPLAGIRVLDLSRVLAGPSCTQLLGDLGADVIKIERPGRGDDTRGWGPPFVERASGAPDASYFLAANRNKRSVAIDLAHPDGAALVREIALRCDVLVENFKAGDLARRGLAPGDLLAVHPALVYCSITGFGQSGPRAAEPGYDAVVQAMGGLMSLTGEPEGAPLKVGVGVADLFTGMHAAVAILAALRHRDASGEGQHLDIALYDAQLAMLANAGQDALVSGRAPSRHGNGHPHIVPYGVFAARDGHVVLAVGNDAQWRRFCDAAGEPALGADPRFARNADRVRRRTELEPRIAAIIGARTRDEWIANLRDAGVPCGPVRDVLEALDDEQVRARAMRAAIPDPRAPGGVVEVIACPIRASRTPPSLRRPPPALGAHTAEVLRELLGADEHRLDALRRGGAISEGEGA